jgi:hypothetical protein
MSPKGGKRKLTNLDNYENDDYDLDYSNVMNTSGSKVKITETMPQLLKSMVTGNDEFQKSLMEITREIKLTDEEIINRFFNSITHRP